MADVYLDHAATTPVDERVRIFLREALAEPQNASSVHRAGQRARAHLEESREQLAALLAVSANEVVFTSGSTEANNLAIRGLVAARAAAQMRTRILTSDLEHSCVRETTVLLSNLGAVELTRMEVLPSGVADIPAGASCDLLCVMAVQNETGVIQDMKGARTFCEDTGARWLCDLTQGFTSLAPDQFAGADFYSISSHKIHGPPGVGVLAGRGIRSIRPQITGGPQEGELRAGTQPVALIRAFAMAAQLAREEHDKRCRHLRALDEAMLSTLRALGIDFAENGESGRRLPGFLNLSFPGLSAPDLVIALDSCGIFVSAGSACATGVMELSPALRAMFPRDDQRAASAIRITPGKDTTCEQIIAAAGVIASIVKKARR
ncbi:cysteine desulfurase [Candidatus Sumerlaeota bacterium]|nr:cysteine desulfurase [Candidatus Sumerlaeota bacterium]